MKEKISLFLEDYIFYPNSFHKILSIVLYPLSFIYKIALLIVDIKYKFKKKHKFPIPIVSIGNLIVGGSGKTPLIIKLASNYKDSVVILRGYKRQTKDTLIVDINDKKAIQNYGDEAVLLANSLPNSLIIVSINRIEGIKKAIQLNKKIVF